LNLTAASVKWSVKPLLVCGGSFLGLRGTAPPQTNSLLYVLQISGAKKSAGPLLCACFCSRRQSKK